MSEAASLDEPSAPTDLEAEWSELGGRSWFGGAADKDDGRPSLWFFPVLLLYVGFFFGPFATALGAVFTMRFRIELRTGAIVLGGCGAAWCLLQGWSLFNGAWWSELELQSMRSAVNFAAGILTYLVVRPAAVTRFRQTLRTLGTSTVIILVGVVVFVLTPSSLLVAMGR